MIPKKLHFCWLSNDAFPSKIGKCIESWRVFLPDYEIKCWNMDNFDVNTVRFVKEACSLKKWAFAADYIRLYALYTEGGIYLDSDVLLRGNLDEYLDYDFFSSIECDTSTFDTIKKQYVDEYGFLLNSNLEFVPSLGIQAAILGGVAGHPYLKDCMTYYENASFILPNGTLNNKIIAPYRLARIAVKYGFLYKDILQKINNGMLILPSAVFAGHPNLATQDSVAIHCYAGSWVDWTLKDKIKKILNQWRGKNSWGYDGRM